MNLAQKVQYDAIVVGSGISGGWAAKELCEKGLKTLVLERGRNVEHVKDYITEHQQPWEAKHRGRAVPPDEAATEWKVQSRTYAFRETTKHFFMNDRTNPYEEVAPFTFIRGDQVGGRSLMWGRQSYRWSDLDFEANALDGHGVDWPIRYKDLEPWYGYVERFIGISGKAEGLPQLPDSEFLPHMEFNAAEKLFKHGVESRFPDRHVINGRVAVLTRPHNGRGACHYCGPCEQGCSVGAYFSSQSSTLPAAAATGNLTLRPNSLVHSVIYDEDTDRATGVRVIDTRTKEMEEVHARVIFLNASTLGTTQILLNTKTPRFSTGLGNSSGALGHYLMDHHYQLGAYGVMAEADDRYYVGNRPNGIYLARFRNLGDRASQQSDYVRGFGFQGSADRPSWERGLDTNDFGADFKHSLRDPGSWSLWLGAWAEALPRRDNTVELSSETDAYGLPQLRINCTWGENELAMRKDIMVVTEEMMDAAGATDVSLFNNYKEGELGAEPGLCIHEMGTARMGKDPKSSVLNGFNQMHDVPNVFVTDGACMASSACQNPSLTYMAITARACDYAVGLLQRGEL
ncbi:MAG: GMC family oxidoreductase [Rhodothermales bacterium]|nr:GMC family oxidoreductase [Rhodothermales bacterium]